MLLSYSRCASVALILPWSVFRKYWVTGFFFHGQIPLHSSNHITAVQNKHYLHNSNADRIKQNPTDTCTHINIFLLYNKCMSFQYDSRRDTLINLKTQACIKTLSAKICMFKKIYPETERVTFFGYSKSKHLPNCKHQNSAPFIVPYIIIFLKIHMTVMPWKPELSKYLNSFFSQVKAILTYCRESFRYWGQNTD